MSRSQTAATNSAAAGRAVTRHDVVSEKAAGPVRSTPLDSAAPAGSGNAVRITPATTTATPGGMAAAPVAMEGSAADGAPAERKAADATTVSTPAREARAGSESQAATSTVPAVRHPAAQGMGPAARPSQPPGALRKLAKVFFWFAAVLGILVMLGLGFLLLNYGSYLF